VLWRDPDTLQVGVERVLVVLRGVSRLEEAVVAALVAGRGDGGVTALAAQLGADAAAVAAAVQRLEPALVHGPRPAAAPGGGAGSPRRSGPAAVARGRPVVRLAGTGPLADAVGRLTEAEGLGVVRVDAESVATAPGDPRSASSTSPAGLAVVVAGLVPDPVVTAEWVRHDVVHLVVRSGDRSVRVGPTVVPGETACMRCLHLHDGAADPAWPALAGQLATAPPFPVSSLVVHEAAAATVRRLLAVLARGPGRDAGAVDRLDHATGEVTRSWSRPRPDCGCAAPPGTGSADAPLPAPGPRRPTTAAGVPGRG
jgi:bacteriocin biosynthesis cyclodehydratase domain-containing protein